MKKYIFAISLFICFNKIVAQDCPQGYEERIVKCNGNFIKKCIPTNLSCNKCWHVEYSDCGGSIDKSIWGNYFNTYDECLKSAQELQASFKPTVGCPNKFKTFRISLNGSKANFCGNSTVANDLKNKIIAFLNRYKAEIKNYKRYFNGQPYRPGAVTKEYQSVINQAEENAKNLSLKLNSLTDENLSQFESDFENIKNDETRLIQVDTEYKNNVQSQSVTNNNKPNTSTKVTTSTNNQQQINKYNTINQNYQTQVENTNQVFNTLQSGLQDISNMISENYRKKGEAIQKQYESDKQRRQQKIQTQLEEDKKKQEEDDRISSEITRQFNVDSSILSINLKTWKTSSISENVDSVYYIGYKRKYIDQANTQLNLKVFAVYRYSDGTFPLFSTIVEKSSHENNITQQGISLLIGFFTTKEATLNAISEIQENAKKYSFSSKTDLTIRKINITSTSKAVDKNFWNQ